MFNKKLIAASIAASLLSANAIAAVNLDATGAALDPIGTVSYAKELIAADVVGGLLDVTTSVDGDLAVDVTLGFTIGAGTSKYVRLDLSTGEFTGAPAVTAVPDLSASISSGGAGESFVIFELTANGIPDIAASQALEFTNATGYTVSGTGTTSITYRLYETATAAANPDAATSLPLKSASKALTTIVTTLTGEYATPNNLVASVSSSFTELTALANENFIGTLDATDLVDLDAAPVDENGVLATTTSVLATAENYEVTLAGNIGFGTFTLNTGANCAAAAVGTFNGTTGLLEDGADPAAAISLTAADFVAGPHQICVAVGADEVFEKGSYTIALNSDSNVDFPETLGTITYDTTSIEVPYLTTFADYNQRVVLVNSGTNEASYSMSFLSEAGTEATGTAAASGVIPAKGMVVLKTTDLVTIVGKTRTSAVIEIEGEESSIQAATQTVNLSDGTTDTVVLNANSVTAYVPPAS